MARFKLKASLIPKLTSAGVISSTTGKIKLRVPAKEGYFTAVKCYEVEFDPTDVLEATNRVAVAALQKKRSPPIKLNSGWLIADPSIAWFDQLADDAAGNIIVVDEAAKEIFNKEDRLMIRKHAKLTGNSLPADFKKSTVVAAAANLTARQYFKDHPEKR